MLFVIKLRNDKRLHQRRLQTQPSNEYNPPIQIQKEMITSAVSTLGKTNKISINIKKDSTARSCSQIKKQAILTERSSAQQLMGNY